MNVDEDFSRTGDALERFLAAKPTEPVRRLGAWEYKYLLARAGDAIYDGRRDSASLNDAWFDGLDVTPHYHFTRKVLEKSDLWNYLKERLTTMGGDEPKDAVVHLQLELELFRFQRNWKFVPKVLAPLLAARGVTRTVTKLLNGPVGVITSQSSMSRQRHVQLRTFFSRAKELLDKNPCDPKFTALDNYQQQRHGSASLGSERRERMAQVIDFVTAEFEHKPHTDVWKLMPNEKAWAGVVDEVKLLEVMNLDAAPWLQKLESRAGRPLGSLGYDLDVNATSRKEQLKKDQVLACMVALREAFFEEEATKPAGSRCRRSDQKFGLGGRNHMGMGAIDAKSSGKYDNHRALAYVHSVYCKAKIDADLGDQEDDVWIADQHGRVWKVRRIHFIGGDHETLPRIKVSILMARLLTGFYDYVFPLPELWHAAGVVLKKFVLGSDYNTRNDWSWMRELFFDFFMRVYRKLGPLERVPWGKISSQYHFTDYYHTCLVLLAAWLSIRGECLPVLRRNLDKRAARLLHDFFENDLPCAVYYIPALKMDPRTARAHLAEFQRVAMRYHATGYSNDILQFIQDYDGLSDDRRRNVDENFPKIVGVIIEYIHGKLAESVKMHSISTVDSINQQHACLESISRGVELLYLLIGKDPQLTATYHTPDILGSDTLIRALAKYLRTLVQRAVDSASAVHPTKTTKVKKKTVTVEDTSRFVISGLFDDKFKSITVAACVLLNETDANKEKKEEAIESIRKVVLLENEIPASKLYTGAVDKKKRLISIAEMNAEQLVAALRAKGQTTSETKVGPLRRQLAPHYRADFARTATEKEHGQLGQVCELTRDLAVGDFSRIGEEGVFAKFKEEEPLLLTPALARDLGELDEMIDGDEPEEVIVDGQ